jgi:hypothetical protein
MRRIGIAITACLLAVSFAAPAAFATAKIIDASAIVTDGALSAANAISSSQPIHGGLFVTFKEVGLGDNAGTNYLVTADASATYGCVNNGSNHPRANNKETVSGPVSASAIFTSDNNGQVSGSIAVAPLDAGSFSCPPGQTLELVEVSYTNVVLCDTTNGVCVTLPGTFTRSFFK